MDDDPQGQRAKIREAVFLFDTGRPLDHERACGIIHDLSPAEAVAVLEFYSVEPGLMNHIIGSRHYGWIPVGAVLGLMLTWMVSGRVPVPADAAGAMSAFALLGLLVAMWMTRQDRAVKRRKIFGPDVDIWPRDRTYATVLTELGELHDVAGVASLIRAVPSPRATFRSVQPALARLLPRVSKADLASIDAEMRLRLYRAADRYDPDEQYLTWPGKPYLADFCIAIIEMAEHIADVEAIPFLRRIAGRTPRTPNQQRLVGAAEKCLATMSQGKSSSG
jgi:hypothetical protein